MLVSGLQTTQLGSFLTQHVIHPVGTGFLMTGLSLRPFHVLRFLVYTASLSRYRRCSQMILNLSESSAVSEMSVCYPHASSHAVACGHPAD